jgi:hypothetical protein
LTLDVHFHVLWTRLGYAPQARQQSAMSQQLKLKVESLLQIEAASAAASSASSAASGGPLQPGQHLSHGSTDADDGLKDDAEFDDCVPGLVKVSSSAWQFFKQKNIEQLSRLLSITCHFELLLNSNVSIIVQE